MADTSPKLSQTKVLSGGKVLIKMDGRVVGFANSMSCSDSYNLQPIHVIGQLEPLEFVPTAATHQIQMQTIMMRNDSLVRHNLEPMTVGGYGFLNNNGDNIGEVTGSIGSYKLIGAGTNNENTANYEKLKSSVQQKNGGQLSVIDGKTFTIAVTDAETQKNIVEYLSCYCTGGSFTVGQNSIIGHSVQFVALDRRGQLDAANDANMTEPYQTEGRVYFV